MSKPYANPWELPNKRVEAEILAKLARLERMVEYLLDHSYNLDQHWREHIKWERT